MDSLTTNYGNYYIISVKYVIVLVTLLQLPVLLNEVFLCILFQVTQ